MRLKASILRAPLFLVLAANMASCVPLLHVVHLRPAVSGIIVEDGNPVPGVELFLGKFAGNNQPCTEVGEVVPVSADGSFTWTSTQERKLTDSLINPIEFRRKITVLCIRHPEKGVLIGAMLFTRLDTPVSLRLLCDPSRPRGSSPTAPNTTSTMVGQNQHCEAITMR